MQSAGSGEAISFGGVGGRANQGEKMFGARGRKAGDHVASLTENRRAFMETCWAAQRAGLYYTAISRYLTQDEIAYIVRDCGARLGTPWMVGERGRLADQSDTPELSPLDLAFAPQKSSAGRR